MKPSEWRENWSTAEVSHTTLQRACCRPDNAPVVIRGGSLSISLPLKMASGTPRCLGCSCCGVEIRRIADMKVSEQKHYLLWCQWGSYIVQLAASAYLFCFMRLPSIGFNIWLHYMRNNVVPISQGWRNREAPGGIGPPGPQNFISWGGGGDRGGPGIF